MNFARTLFASTIALTLLAGPLAAQTSADHMLPGDRAIPRYTHIFVIVEENKDYETIMNGKSAPGFSRFAHTYGNASQFFGETHPSEANYVALLAGSTFGIHDDDAFFCHPGTVKTFCSKAAAEPGYADHTITALHLGDQLTAAGLTWKGYYESIPAPGSLAIVGDSGGSEDAYYAAKHSGFLNFANVQTDPHRAELITTFEALAHDRAAGTMPNFALIVPNQCNEMHGLSGKNVPADCHDAASLITRGDVYTAKLVDELMNTASWKSSENDAIVITFDEGSGGSRGGCCGNDPNSVANYGSGRIPTIVVTNHGPRGLDDPTPYNHYSLLRTIEDAFGITTHLQLAGAVDSGVRPMTPLFAVRASR